jgi:hypothetical protein
LLLAALAPAAAGLWAISGPYVDLLVAEPFRAMTIEVLPWAILAGSLRSLRVHFGEHVFLLREETLIPLATDAVDGLATIAGAIVGLALGGLVGCVMGAACGSGVGLFVTLVWGAYRHSFLFPLVDFLKIGGAALAMVVALSFVPVKPHVLSIASAIALGAVIYAFGIGVLYPDRTRSFWQKLRSVSRA